MIKIIPLSLLTLLLLCTNAYSEPATVKSQKNTSAAASSAKPEQETMAPEAARKIHIPELKLTPEDNGHKAPAKPASRRKSAAKASTASIPAARMTPAIRTDSTTADSTKAAAVRPLVSTRSGDGQGIAESTLSGEAVITPLGITAIQPTLSVLEVPTLTVGEKQKHRKHFLPTRRRIDREVNKLKFAYKGEVMMGLTASYGTLSSDDTDFMLIIDNINAKGTIASVKPFIGYFYRDNNCVGVRFGYNHVGGSINTLDLDLGASNNVSFGISNLNLTSDNYSLGIFHRSYAGLDPKGRFGLFAEFELSASSGSSEFTYESGGVPKSTFSDNTQVKLSFNPGAAVYIFPNVCATLSFGLGGLQYTSVTQKDAAGNKIGTRKSSNMKFKLNIAAINIGMTIHLWDKKK